MPTRNIIHKNIYKKPQSIPYDIAGRIIQNLVRTNLNNLKKTTLNTPKYLLLDKRSYLHLVNYLKRLQDLKEKDTLNIKEYFGLKIIIDPITSNITIKLLFDIH